MTDELSQTIMRSLKKYYGNVNPDLKYGNIYQLSVSVILSAQTTDAQVNAVTPELFKRYPDFISLSQAKTDDVEGIIKSTGFFRNKSKNIIEFARAVTQKYDGTLPRGRDELTKLPGIGRKSANVILSMGYDIPALAVDTHIIRIAKRLGYTDSANPLIIEKSLIKFIPEKKWKEAHLLLIRHGRKICKARRPLCSQCPISSYCNSSDKILQT